MEKLKIQVENCKKKLKFSMSAKAYKEVPNVVTNVKMLSSRTLWHQRLGHAPMARSEEIRGPNGMKTRAINVCLTCPLAKFTKLPCNLSDSRAKEPFELIHIDTRGQSELLLKEGIYIYITLTTVDDHSKDDMGESNGSKI